jgi:ribosome modulation factor
MKEKHDVPGRAALDHEQAFRRGYDDAQSGRVVSRDQSPFREPTVRKHWKRGFDLGSKGLIVTLPKL